MDPPDATESWTRRLWQAIEPVHLVAYFAPEPVDAMRQLGLRGWWMGYFAGRFGPMGAVGAAPVVSLAYSFAHRRVERALPDAWKRADPYLLADAWIDAAGVALRRHLAAETVTTLETLDALLWEAVRTCRFDGRPLAAAWSQMPRPQDPAASSWLAATVLREHRGDGHVFAAVHAGFEGIEAALTHAATGAFARQTLETSRGWTHDELDAATHRLTARGLLTDDGVLTDAGKILREGVERATDRLASAPVRALGVDFAQRVVDVAAPLSRHLIDSGCVPIPNPVGAPRP